MKDPALKTINYIQTRAEVELPAQIAKAEQALGHLTMKYYGQLQFEGCDG